MPEINRPNGKLLLKNNENGEKLLYDTRNGVSWKGRPEFENGPVAKVRREVRL